MRRITSVAVAIPLALGLLSAAPAARVAALAGTGVPGKEVMMSGTIELVKVGDGYQAFLRSAKGRAPLPDGHYKIKGGGEIRMMKGRVVSMDKLMKQRVRKQSIFEGIGPCD